MAKKKKMKKKKVKVGFLYESKGDFSRKRKSCPKCGPGCFMAEHKNRITCGKCHYTEMKKKE